jgi:ABC transport system ATP-binding/permease protein
MDEPTNDLDVETLELLEELLLEYKGTLLLVSHDRAFINNVVTSTIAFEGDGELNEYVGGYDDWLRQCEAATKQRQAQKSIEKDGVKKASTPRGKLSYKDQRELDGLPKQIEQLEAELAALHQAMAEPDYYKQDGEAIAKSRERLEKMEGELAAAYVRWEVLEALRDGLS